MLTRLVKKLLKKVDRRLRHREPRVQVSTLHGIHFVGEGCVGALEVWNLSESGVGLRPKTTHPMPVRGQVLVGSLSMPKASFPAELEVAFASETVIGCRFIGAYQPLREQIRDLILIELAAMQMSEVRPEILRGEPDGAPRLFRGRNNCELFMVERAGELVRFQLSLFGTYIEGGRGFRTKVGYLSGVEKEKPKYKGSSLVRLVSAPPPDLESMAWRFLENVSGLSAGQRDFMRSAISALCRERQA